MSYVELRSNHLAVVKSFVKDEREIYLTATLSTIYITPGSEHTIYIKHEGGVNNG